ncbi:MAG: LPS assembly lipoprotein LptE [Candidatus Sumerlaeia bacterium]
MYLRLKISAIFLAVTVLCLVSNGCRVTPYERKLPEWVRRIHVIMAENKTTEPGLEELVTNALIEKVMEDGRLELTTRSRADAVVRIKIESFTILPRAFSDDNVARQYTIIMTASLFLYEPNDLENAFAQVRDTRVVYAYEGDYRSTSAITRPQALRALANEAGYVFLNDIFNRVDIIQE